MGSESLDRNEQIPLNENGQPPACLGVSRVARRGIDELIGLCKGILADGRLVKEEADFLLSWLNLNQGVHDVWPANILVARFEKILEDGVVDRSELEDLQETMRKMLGGAPVFGYQGSMATRLPVTDPAPYICFADKSFVLTGTFVYGTRKTCEQQIQLRGGIAESSLNRTTDYLIIGAIGSRDWAHSTHGRKIEKAIASNVPVVAEEHWTKFL